MEISIGNNFGRRGRGSGLNFLIDIFCLVVICNVKYIFFV